MDQTTKEHYRQLLARYREQADEASLLAAAELGRALLRDQVPPEDLVEWHHQVLAEWSAQDASFTLAEALHIATAPLMEALMAYGLMFREQLARRERLGRANLEAVTEQSRDLIVITDRQGRVEYVNQAFLDRTGYTMKECLGATPGRLVKSGRQAEAVYRELWRTIEAGQSWQGRLLDRDKAGNLFVVDTSIFPLRDHSDIIVQYVSISRDITERVAIERAFQEKSQRLEAVATLAAGIAHDANNLLGMILGYADLVAADATDPLMSENLEQIKLAALHTRDLVGQILAFARRDRAGNDLELVRVADVAHEVFGLLRASTGPNLRLTVHEHFAAATVAVRRGQLTQVLMNLALNAEQAMGFDDGRIDIEIGHTHAPPDGFGLPLREDGYITIDVVDNGPGIPWELQARVFDPFFTTKNAAEGTGLGLSVAKNIIERHQGAIELWSEPGQGTRFSIVLPFVRGIAPAAATTATDDRVALIVDDDLPQLRIIKSMAARAGIRTLVTDNPWTALKAFHNDARRFFAVATDQFMPELDGTRMVQHMRDINPDLLVILFSAEPELIDQAALAAQGIAAFLPKPIDYERLIALLRAGQIQ